MSIKRPNGGCLGCGRRLERLGVETHHSRLCAFQVVRQRSFLRLTLFCPPVGWRRRMRPHDDVELEGAPDDGAVGRHASGAPDIQHARSVIYRDPTSSRRSREACYRRADRSARRFARYSIPEQLRDGFRST